MKINYDCMRKVLFVLAECLDLDKYFDPEPMTIDVIVKIPALSEFSEKDIAHSIYMLSDAGLIVISSARPTLSDTAIPGGFSKSVSVLYITYKGQKFLQEIQNETIWKKAKEKLEPLGAMTIELISQVIVGLITQKLGL